MKKRNLNRRTALVILCLFIALGLVFAGLYQGADPASADISIPSFTTFDFHFFVASDFYPADGATGVSLAVTPSVKFNYELDSTTFKSANFYMVKAGSLVHLPALILYSPATDKATINPSSNLLPGTTYHVVLTSDIKDEDGYSLLNAGQWTFTTDTAPIVVSRNPEPNELNVPVNQNVSITFDKKMALATITGSTFWVKKQGGNKVPGVITLSADKKTVIFNPDANLEPDTVYEVSMTSGVESETYVQAFATTTTYLFKTAANAPVVSSTTPANGASGVLVTVTCSATFDQTMDATTITSATFYIAKQGGSPLPANVTYNAASKAAILDPLSDLEPGATYQVTLSNAVKGSGGQTLAGAPYTWTFTTASAAPSVTTKSPAAGATNVPVTDPVSATFDQTMDATTITSATFYIAKQGGSPLPANVTYNPATKTATLDPLAVLEAGATYQVTLSNAIKGSGGLTLAGAPVSWTFTTASAAAPTFSDVIPGVTPYSTAIGALAADGIITGFSDGTFRPNDFVTRQQFAKMIVLTMGYPVTGAEVCPFTDVVAQSGTDPFYPSKYVAVCAAYGITTGKTPTTFAPYETITHQQLITMVVRAAALSDPPAAFTPSFSSGQFSLYDHFLNARKAASAGLLNGLLGVGPSYAFMAGSTRGECAQLLYNLSVLLGS